MKSVFILCMALIIYAACTKNGVKPGAAVSASSEDMSVIKTRSANLVSHPWKYNAYYIFYHDQQHKGDPQYIRGNSNNIIDMNLWKFIFRKNGTFVELRDDGGPDPGTWHFTDNTASLLVLEYSHVTNNDSILILNNNHLNYTQPAGYQNMSKNYSELIPAQ